MSYNDGLPPYLENAHFEMDAKFCARIRAAIAQRPESAPIGIVATPGTKNPKCIANQIARYDRSRDEQ